MEPNLGFDAVEIARRKEEMVIEGKPFLYTDEVQLPDFKHFYFVGIHEGKEVIFDAVLYTLRMFYESKLYEIAEEEAVKEFPDYKPYDLRVGDNGELEAEGEVDEEVEEYKASIIMELQEDDDIKVQELVQHDDSFDYGIGLEVVLNVEEVTDEVVSKFIADYKAGTLRLDEGLYSFEIDDEDEDEEN